MTDAASEPAEQPFDLSSLPPIEAITAGTDIRAFLQSGVPAELTKAALRRAWTTDPAIRDFIGIAENQWDFTDPNAIPGFGPLEPSDDVRKLVEQAMGRLGEPGAEAGVPDAGRAQADQSRTDTTGSQTVADIRSPAQVSGIPDRSDGDTDRASAVERQDQAVSGAPQHAQERAESASTSNRRGHGRALPE
jgi:hypothetical protein